MSIGWNETGGSLPFPPKPYTPSINWAAPLTQGLVFDANYAMQSAQNGWDLAMQRRGVYTGTAPNVGPFGPHRTFLANTDKDAYTLIGAAAAITNTLSVEFIFKGNVAQFGVVVSIGGVSGSDGEAFLDVAWDDTANCITTGFGRATTSSSFRDTNGVFTANQFVHCILTYDGTSTANVPSIYKNGAAQPVTTATAGSGARIANNGSVLVGNFPGQTFGILADIEYVRLWNRILTPQEAQTLAGNPWLIYNQPPPPSLTEKLGAIGVHKLITHQAVRRAAFW